MPRKKQPAPRRAAHEGSVIVRTDGLVVVRHWTKTDLDRWTKHESYLPRGATRADGEALLAQLNAARTLDLPAVFGRETFTTYLPLWLSEIVTPRAKPKTVDSYRYALGHLMRHIGHLALRELTPRHVRALKVELERTLAPTSTAFVLTVLKAALSDAMREELVNRNVAALVPIGAPRPADVTPLTADQARAVLDALIGHPLRVLFELAIYRGLRSGEIRGLTWPALDLDAGLLDVRHTLYHGRGDDWRLVAPKTPRSRRTIPLSATLVQSLHERKAQQLHDQLRVGSAWQNTLDLVLTDATGRPLSDQTAYKLYQQACRVAGVPAGRVHGLRHTANSLMAAEGVDDSTRMAILGHSTITMNQTYVHTDAERVTAALERLERKIREG